MNLLINEEEFIPNLSDVVMNRIYSKNHTPNDFFRYLYDLEYMKKYHIKYQDMSSKQIFKRVFGPQLTCINYSYRCWIWTFSNEGRTAVVNCLVDKRGVHWEYKRKSPFHTVVSIVQEIEKRLIEFKENK